MNASLQRPAVFLAAAAFAMSTAGCGTTLSPSVFDPVTGYQAANAFAPLGHHVESLPGGGVRVTATGTAATPAARLEKIALARAAEYGAEQGQGSFTATPANVSIICGKSSYSERGKTVNIKPTDLRVVSVDVTYGKAGVPDARETRGTADMIKAELAGEVVPPEMQSTLMAEVSSQCRRG